MPALGSDQIRKLTNNFSTTLSSAMAPADTTVGLNSVTGLPTDTAIDLVVDRVDANGNLTPAKREFIKGIVAGSTLTSVTRGLGNSTAQAHASSAVVEMVWTSDTHNDMASALLTSHNQDGTLKSGSVTNAAIASSAVDSTKLATGAVVTASITDANITYPKINFSTLPYGSLTFSTYGSSAGIVVGTGTSSIAFDAFSTNSSTSITKQASGVFKVTDAGVYSVELNVNVVDKSGTGTIIVNTQWSPDNTTWYLITNWTEDQSVDIGRAVGARAGTVTLPANSYVRSNASVSATTSYRLAAPSANEVSSCALSIWRIG